MRSDNVKTRIVQQANNETLAGSNLDEIDENITENIAALKEQVEIAIKSVDENLIDSMLVGQTKIQKNKAVILSWSLDQNGPLPQSLESQDTSYNQTKDDGNPISRPSARTSSLKSSRSGSINSKPSSSGKPPTL